MATESPEASIHVLRAEGDTSLLLQYTTHTQVDQHVHFKDIGSDWYIGNKWNLDSDGFGIGRTSEKTDFVIDSAGNVGDRNIYVH